MGEILYFGIGGLICLALAFHIWRAKNGLLQKGGRAAAEVRMTPRANIVALRYTVDGRVYEREYTGGVRPRYKDGENTIEVVYWKDKPDKMMVVADSRRRDIGALILLVGGIFSIGLAITRFLAY